MTDAMPRPNHAERADLADSTPTQFATSVEARADGQWLAVVSLGEGASVCKLFDSELDARQYGDELAAWLVSRASA